MNTARLHRHAPRGAHRSVWLACLGVALCTHAQSQPLHRCRIDGRMVVQAAPCATAPQVVPATLHPALVADTADEPPKKRTLADILREREADNRARKVTHEPQIDGSKILRDRMGAR